MLTLSKKPSRKAPQSTVTKPDAVEGSLTITAESAASAVIAIPSTGVKTEVNAVLEVIKRIDSVSSVYDSLAPSFHLTSHLSPCFLEKGW